MKFYKVKLGWVYDKKMWDRKCKIWDVRYKIKNVKMLDGR